MEQEDITSLYEGVLNAYDYNTKAITLHISYLSTKSRKTFASSIKNNKTAAEIKDEDLDFHIAKLTLSSNKINEDLELMRRLEKYRFFFEKIMETKMDVINRFKKLSEFDISGEGDIYYKLYRYSEDIDNVEEFNEGLSKELTNIVFYANKILENIGGK